MYSLCRWHYSFQCIRLFALIRHFYILWTYWQRIVLCWGMANNKSPLHQYLQTKYMIFHPRQKGISHVTLEPTLNGDKMERVDNFNFPNKHISWKYHTKMSSNQIPKYCGILSRLKNCLPLFILRTMYFSMVRSHLNYGLLAWDLDSNRIIKL